MENLELKTKISEIKTLWMDEQQMEMMEERIHHLETDQWK